jgi:hypothetical protein
MATIMRYGKCKSGNGSGVSPRDLWSDSRTVLGFVLDCVVELADELTLKIQNSSDYLWLKPVAISIGKMSLLARIVADTES